MIAAPAFAQEIDTTPNYAPGGPTDHWVPQHFDQSGRYVPGHYEQKKKPKFMGYFAPGETKPGQRGYPLPTPDYGQNAADADQPQNGAGQQQ